MKFDLSTGTNADFGPSWPRQCAARSHGRVRHLRRMLGRGHTNRRSRAASRAGATRASADAPAAKGGASAAGGASQAVRRQRPAGTPAGLARTCVV